MLIERKNVLEVNSKKASEDIKRDLEINNKVKYDQSIDELDKLSNTADIKIFRESIPILIPLKIKRIMDGLNSKFPAYEFSILTKTSWNGTKYIMDNEYFIPRQDVTSAHIDYLEDNTDFNTVIHKHPGSGMSNFSAEDNKYINSNFKFSVLWCGGSFIKGLVRITDIDTGVNIMNQLSVSVSQEDPIIPEEADEKIRHKEYPVCMMGFQSSFPESWNSVYHNEDRYYVNGNNCNSKFENDYNMYKRYDHSNISYKNQITNLFETDEYKSYRESVDKIDCMNDEQKKDEERLREHQLSGILNKYNSDLDEILM